jgi:1-acyl-sn-glycerol-3-phosphate acyltransferase
MAFLRNICNLIYSGYCIVVFFIVIFFQMVGFIAVSWMPERRRVLTSYKIAQWVSIVWLKLCGYTIVVEGAEKVDRNKTYMFVCNHSNLLDLPMTAYFMTFYYKSLAKTELKYVPIFSYLIQRSAVLVDRSSAESRKRSMMIVADLLKNGLSFLIFPEGTRNKTGKPLKEFFSGAFKMAIMAQVPVQPFVFLDHHELQPVRSYRFHPGRLRIKVLDAIETKGMQAEDAQALQDRVYKVMEETILMEDVDFRGR